MKNIKNYLIKRKTAIFSFLFIVVVIFAIFYNIQVNISICSENSVLIIDTDDTTDNVINKIDEKYCLNNFVFKILLRYSGKDTKIKPGTYNLEEVDNMHTLIDIITSDSLVIKYKGSVVKDIIKFSLIEGWNINDIALNLSKDERLNVDGDKFIELCYSDRFINTLGINNNSLEGYLYPNTYYLHSFYTEEDIIKVFMDEFYNVLIDIEDKLNDTFLNKEEVIILASIIQSESKYIDEMPVISSVFYNRLADGVPLQADPTILYYMSEKDLKIFKDSVGTKLSRDIFNKYKKIDNLYNTYFYNGLPYGAICNPSLPALLAAIYPDSTEYFYFTANKEGKHYFSKTYEEHKNKINETRLK